MTNNVKFFDKQSEITNQKLEFYKNYIYNYSMKLLMGYGKLFIADLFCGCGYNGASKGSPLIVIDILNKVLTDKTLLRTKPNSEVILLLNDGEKKNMDELSDNLKSHPINEKIKIFTINEDFCGIINKVKGLKDFKTIPKFFFLDPFSYSTISLSNLRLLFDLGNSEVLMFSPIFDAYRFKTAKNILENEDHKTRKFIEEFTCDGLIDYSDIYEFNNSIKEKLRIELTTNYVKYILLEGGKRKNALFHLTNHISGSILFTKIARKLGDYGMGIDIKFKEKTKNQICLFEPHQLQGNQFIDAFEKILISELKKKKLSNLDILELTTIYGFEPKETTNILKKHKNNIEIEAMPNYSRGFYISEEAWKENIRCYINFKD